MEPGIYRIYKLQLDIGGIVHKHLRARVLINNGHLQYLEDHHGFHRLLKPGAIDPRRWESLQSNPYMEFVHEGDLAKGKHLDHIEDLDLGEVKPEAIFKLIDGDGEHHMEVYRDSVVVDGTQLTDTEQQKLMGEIHLGKKQLQPV